MITYRQIESKAFKAAVFLDGKFVGEIRHRPGGYFYKPSRRAAGDHFPTLEACKASLEAA